MSIASDDKRLAGPGPATNARWVVFALACATSFLLYLHRYTWGFIKSDVQREFGWSLEQLGLLDGMFSASYAIGQVPFGILCDWFGPHLLLTGLIVTWSVSMGAAALATGLTSMAIYRFLFGLTQAGCYPVLSKITRLWFPLSTRTFVQGWVATFFGRGGGAISFFLFGTVLLGYFQMPWRYAVGMLTVVGIVFAFVFAFLFRNTPAEHPWANAAEVELIDEGVPDAAPATRSALRWGTVFRSGNMMVFLFQQFTSAYADNVYVYWIPLFLLTSKNVELSGAGWMSALPLVGGAVGGMLGGALQNWLIVRTGNRRWARSGIGCVGKLAATIFMFSSMAFDSALMIVSLFALVKFFGDWSQPTVWGTVTDIAGRNSASVFAVVNTIGSLAGFIAGPTMGLVVMMFAEPAGYQESVAAVQPAEPDGKLVFSLSRKPALADGFRAELHGNDFHGVVAATDDGVRWESDPPSEEAGKWTFRLDKNRGQLIVSGATAQQIRAVDVSYQFLDYGAGWTALFLLLGGIYLASSLSWLFIDCTKPLE